MSYKFRTQIFLSPSRKKLKGRENIIWFGKVGMIHFPDSASRQPKSTQKGFPNVNRKEGFNKLYNVEFTN